MGSQIDRLRYGISDLKTKGIFFLKCAGNPELKKKLRDNLEFMDKYRGSRCFVLGNGPSLKDENLSVLESEFVFTVNQAAKLEGFSAMKTNFHFWADEMFFLDDPVMLNTMKQVNTGHNHPVVFFPIERLDFVHNNQLDQVLDVRYFKAGSFFNEYYKRRIRYDRIVPGFATVVQYAVTMAVYMGFSEIYLLGCDNTGLITTIQSALRQNLDNDYAYHISDAEKKRIENLLTVHSLEQYTQSYLDTLRFYRFLYTYCIGRGVKLVNCSSQTVIDSIPRATLESVIRS